MTHLCTDFQSCLHCVTLALYNIKKRSSELFDGCSYFRLTQRDNLCHWWLHLLLITGKTASYQALCRKSPLSQGNQDELLLGKSCSEMRTIQITPELNYRARGKAFQNQNQLETATEQTLISSLWKTSSAQGNKSRFHWPLTHGMVWSSWDQRRQRVVLWVTWDNRDLALKQFLLPLALPSPSSKEGEKQGWVKLSRLLTRDCTKSPAHWTHCCSFLMCLFFLP